MTPLRTLIIEDEPPAARRLQKLLTELDAALIVESCLESVSAAVDWLVAHPRPDLIFMDIQLSDGLSLDIFKQVSVESPVIFTTAYDEFALQAFKVNSIDYLLKPVSIEELGSALDKYRRLSGAPFASSAPKSLTLTSTEIESIVHSLVKQQPSYRTRFLLEQRERLLTVKVEEVAYFYSEHKLTHLVPHAGKVHVIEQTMEELEEQLNPVQFFRANRQVMVCERAITGIHKHFAGKLKLTLAPVFPSELMVSRERAGSFKAWLDK